MNPTLHFIIKNFFMASMPPLAAHRKANEYLEDYPLPAEVNRMFKATGLHGNVHCFDEANAPNWLCKGGPSGSTMDNRWFWNNHVMTLEVGETVETDFQVIERVA